MVNPTQVYSPRNSIAPGSLRVIYTSNCSGWSIAQLVWDGAPALAIRWNGDLNDPKDLGHPRSHQHPTWFILPETIAHVVRGFIAASLTEAREEARAVLAAEGIDMDAVSAAMEKENAKAAAVLASTM
jgi:hypothetical protein